MNIYRIYRATNIISGKVYIGFTSESLKNRMAAHKRKALVNLDKNKLYDAIRSYGWNSFVWEEIYNAKEEIPHRKSHTLTVMENHFVKEYNSINAGYNIVPGGGGFPDSAGLNNPMFNKKHKKESIELMKKNRTGKTVGANNGMYGVKRTEEWLDNNQRGENHPMYGKKMGEDSVKNIRGPDIKCEHCGKVANRANYHRWHGNNCKLSPSAIETTLHPLDHEI